MVRYSRVLTVLAVTGVLGVGETRTLRVIATERPGFAVDYEPGDKLIPRWGGGYLIAIDDQPDNAPLISVFGSQGTRLFARQLAIDGVARVIPRAGAASSQGVFAVAGGAYDSDGTTANFIAFMDRSGNVTRVVRLKEFAAMQIHFSPDGRLWTAGRAVGGGDSQESGDSGIIRIYDRNGRLERTTLSLSLMAHKRHPAIGASYLASTREKVVFFSSETGYVAELSHNGEVQAVRQAPLSPNTLVTGLAVSERSGIVISSQRRAPTDSLSQIVELHLLEPGATRWMTINSLDSRQEGLYRIVFGFEGDSLLVGSMRPMPTFAWVRIGP